MFASATFIGAGGRNGVGTCGCAEDAAEGLAKSKTVLHTPKHTHMNIIVGTGCGVPLVD